VACAHQRGDLRERRGGEQDALADDGVLAHEHPLLGGERSRLAEDFAGNRDLVDIVKLGGAADGPDLLGWRPSRAATRFFSSPTP
jgi:hypothetical protein